MRRGALNSRPDDRSRSSSSLIRNVGPKLNFIICILNRCSSRASSFKTG